MKNIFFFIIALVNTGSAQNLQWAKQMGGTNFDYGNSIAVDGSGSVYTTGSFVGTADFDPSLTATFNLTSSNKDIFISKLDASGNFLWAKQIMGGSDFDRGNSIVVDGSGNVYTTGYFQGTADFDPGPGNFNLISAGDNDIFISKLDSSGNFLWAKQMGGTNDDKGQSIFVDGTANVYSTGYFKGTADFDPDTGTFNLTANYYDAFVCKLDSSGNFLWAKKIGGAGSDESTSIVVDNKGNVYTTGYFSATADFDPGPGIVNQTSAGYDDIFISKIDSLGNFVWAKQMGGTNVDWGSSIALDDSGNVYSTGSFSETADFDPDTGTFNLTASNSRDVFISKLDSSGKFLWANQMGGSVNDYSYSIALDGSGNVYNTGSFGGTVDFDPGSGTFNLTSAGLYDIFIRKLNAMGDFVWAEQIGGTDDDIGRSVAVDDSGNVYTTGSFWGTADFDPESGIVNLTSSGKTDIFVTKFYVKRVLGNVFNDQNQNCLQDSLETGVVSGMIGIINPGNLVVVTDSNGSWYLNSLPAGNYTIIYDTSGNWKSSCPFPQSFTVVNPDSFLIVSSGMYNTNPCFGDSGDWTKKANFGGAARYEAVGFSIGSKGYIGTGYENSDSLSLADFWEYNPATNIWTQKANFGGGARSGAVGFSIGAKGYVGTGHKDSNQIYYKDFWEYDPATNTWIQKADFGGTSRFSAVGFIIGNKGYIGLGRETGGTNPVDFWEWDQSTNMWSQKADFSGIGRIYSVGFSLGAFGYVGTGFDGASGLFQDFWEWDQSNNIWAQKSDFSGGVRYGAISFSIEDKGYLGTGSGTFNQENDLWEWNQATDTWSQIADFDSLGRHTAVAFSIDNKGYIGTGFNYSTYTTLKDFWEFAVCDSGNVGISSKILSASDNRFSIIPNPNDGTFEIRIPNSTEFICAVKVFNILGKTVYSAPNLKLQTLVSIDLSKHPGGMYYVQVVNNGETMTQKAIIK